MGGGVELGIMRFVPIKTEDQQVRLMVHRARQGFVTERTACINRIRGLLSEFGIVAAQGRGGAAQGAQLPRRPARLCQPRDWPLSSESETDY